MLVHVVLNKILVVEVYKYCLHSFSPVVCDLHHLAAGRHHDCFHLDHLCVAVEEGHLEFVPSQGAELTGKGTLVQF